MGAELSANSTIKDDKVYVCCPLRVIPFLLSARHGALKSKSAAVSASTSLDIPCAMLLGFCPLQQPHQPLLRAVLRCRIGHYCLSRPPGTHPTCRSWPHHTLGNMPLLWPFHHSSPM
ncbi:hypothetical protein LX32DRAFT_203640 [Colletotrichum zoysiae]|uniref:Uncharacterized protein n=1 Tax=Colletotrichum zoysiae TaxID=1216348 RepID=A0AAD9LVN7_9PEZI|nr:hypothetical protein LX32DRAFT_203640 [Colletotrichum zoysiae]